MEPWSTTTLPPPHGRRPLPEPLERTIPDPGFADDAGEADPRLARALTDRAAGTAGSGAVLALLQDARLLVPVVAVLGEVEVDEQGLAHDKSSDMAAVLVQAPDGSTGLLAFTSTASMARWDPAGQAGAGAGRDRGHRGDPGRRGGAARGPRRPRVVRRRRGRPRPARGRVALVALGDGSGGHGWIGPSTE